MNRTQVWVLIGVLAAALLAGLWAVQWEYYPPGRINRFTGTFQVLRCPSGVIQHGCEWVTVPRP